MSQLLTPRWFEIPQRALHHPEQMKLISDLKQKKYYHMLLVSP